jgi:hypothetical protein
MMGKQNQVIYVDFDPSFIPEVRETRRSELSFSNFCLVLIILLYPLKF